MRCVEYIIHSDYDRLKIQKLGVKRIKVFILPKISITKPYYLFSTEIGMYEWALGVWTHVKQK